MTRGTTRPSPKMRGTQDWGRSRAPSPPAGVCGQGTGRASRRHGCRVVWSPAAVPRGPTRPPRCPPPIPRRRCDSFLIQRYARAAAKSLDLPSAPAFWARPASRGWLCGQLPGRIERYSSPGSAEPLAVRAQKRSRDLSPWVTLAGVVGVYQPSTDDRRVNTVLAPRFEPRRGPQPGPRPGAVRPWTASPTSRNRENGGRQRRTRARVPDGDQP